MTGSELLVVGLGAPDRGDDAVGPWVAGVVRGWGRPGVRVCVHEDPTDLVQLWEGYRAVVVIDAVASGQAPGTVVTRRVGSAGESLSTNAWATSGRGGTHAFGLAGAVELARALGTLPEHVAVVGVEAATFEHGPMSREVAVSVPYAAAAVSRELEALADATSASTFASKGGATPCA